MKHAFLPSALNPSECGTCGYNQIAHHHKLAQCEACDERGNCDVYPKPKHPKAMLLCEKCIRKEEEANSVVIARTQLSVVEKAREIDSAIRLNGDFFNAETISLAAIQQEVMRDDSLTEPQKIARVQTLVIERIERFTPIIRKLDDKKHQLATQQHARLEFLRNFGSQLREEIRERIKQSDANYQPHKKPVVPKVAKPKAVTPFDRIAQNLATRKGISIEAARQLLLEGGFD